jgi:hypothetical protein
VYIYTIFFLKKNDSVPRKSKLHDLFIKLRKGLGPVFTSAILDALRQRLIEENQHLVPVPKELPEEEKLEYITEKITKYLFSKVTGPNPYDDYLDKNRNYFSFKVEPTTFEIAVAYRTGKYFSNESALYLNGIQTTPPTNHYLSTEKQRLLTKQKRNEYSFENAKSAYAKMPRISSNYIKKQKEKVYLLEKQFINKKGVIKRSIKFEDYDEIEVEYTNISRTIVDSLITPHYSGGIINVIKIIHQVQLDIDEVTSIIKLIDPYYPYWQVLGFILNILGKTKDEEKLNELFSQHKKVDFFLDRKFKDSWAYDSNWKIYYPKKIKLLQKELSL